MKPIKFNTGQHTILEFNLEKDVGISVCEYEYVCMGDKIFSLRFELSFTFKFDFEI